MPEFAYDHRQSVTTVVGPVSATILGPAPPQQSYEIVEVAVVPFGTVGGAVVVGALMQFATLQGYSPFGTILGTVVEPFSASPGVPFIDGNGRAPIAYVDPGNLLYGQTLAGSCEVKVVFRPQYQRG